MSQERAGKIARIKEKVEEAARNGHYRFFNTPNWSDAETLLEEVEWLEELAQRRLVDLQAVERKAQEYMIRCHELEAKLERLDSST